MISLGLRIATVVLGAIIISQPCLSAENWPDSVDQYIAQIRKTIGTTDIDGYLASVRDPSGALLVDVRDASEFNAGHVPGAINVPRSRLERQIWKPLGYPNPIDMNRKIYTQCDSGVRATLAAKQLKDLGFTNVTIVVMSLEEWQKRGHPFVKAETK